MYQDTEKSQEVSDTEKIRVSNVKLKDAVIPWQRLILDLNSSLLMKLCFFTISIGHIFLFIFNLLLRGIK